MGPLSFQRHLAFNQNAISGIILFFTVGIYLAVLGLGAGGGKPSSQRVSDISNLSLYAIFGIFGFFTGSILNKLGPKLTMTIGVFGYPFYVSGLFCYDRTGGEAYPIIGGVVLGLTAPMLWSTSGYIQWAYATEAEKGLYISLQYFINQVGSAVGSLIAFIIILKGANTTDGSPTPVYIAFIVLMCVAFIFTVFGLVQPSKVRRADGTAIAIFHNPTWKEEFLGVREVLREWRVILMTLVMFSCELPLAIIPSMNGAYFNLRTRAMNPIIFYLLALPSTWLVTYLTDKSAKDRKTRGIYAVTWVSFLVLGCWILFISWISVSNTFKNPPTGGVDWTDTEHFAGPFVIYLLFGILYTCHQLVGMWVLGTFSNDPRVAAIYGGLWKGIAGLGLAVFFGIAAAKVPFRNQAIAAMCLQVLSLPILFFMVMKYCTDTNYGHEADVVVPHYAEEQFNVHTIIGENGDPVIEGRDGSQPEFQEMKLEKGEKN